MKAPVADGLQPMTKAELGELIAQANDVLVPPNMVCLALPKAKALWLINAGCSELRRSDPEAWNA